MKKEDLTQAEQIEYYLGKDSYKDVYFNPEFPHAYEIGNHGLTKENTTSVTRNFNVLWQPNLEFKMNNLGYRSDEDYSVDAFRGKKLVLCFGCTDTLGMHDIKENTWPYILPNHIDSQYKVLNLGVIGASRDTIARLLIKLTGVLSDEINHVCILWPHPNRREFVSKEYTKIITSHDKHNLPYEEYWDYIDWRSNNYNMMKNKHLIKNVCSLNNIQLSDLEIERFDSKVPFDFSGEYNAFGRNTHTAIASYFAKIINGEESLFKKISS